jgi:hypothetical protein
MAQSRVERQGRRNDALRHGGCSGEHPGARSRSLCGGVHPSWVVGGLTVVLLLGGCGQSSGGKSTHTSTAKSAQPTAHTPDRQADSGVTVQRPSVSSSISAAGVVTGSSGGVTATLHAGTHHPKVGVPWPIRFTVSSGERPARASVRYEYLFGGQVVAHRSHYTFAGRFSDVFKWPSSAVGYPLTFRAVIASGGMTIDLDYAVQVIA